MLKNCETIICDEGFPETLNCVTIDIITTTCRYYVIIIVSQLSLLRVSLLLVSTTYVGRYYLRHVSLEHVVKLRVSLLLALLLFLVELWRW